MKKLWTILILCLVCVLCAVGFAACDDKTDSANQNTEQGQTEQGDAITKAQLSASYKLVAKTAWAKLGFENVLEEKTATTFSTYSVSLPETGVKLTEGTFNWAALRGNAGASVALINLIGDYYKNENFVITDKVVSFEIEDVHYSPSGEQVRIPSTLSMRPKIDAENKKVEVELRMKNEQYDNYYYFDLGFDFETKTLNYFVFGLHVMGTYSMQKMDTDGDFYFANDGGADGAEMLPSAEFKAEVDKLEADFKTAIADGLTLTGNFQSEYDNFGTVSSKIFFESVNSVNDNGNGSTGNSQNALTKDEFFAELEKREAATLADSDLHYATIDYKYIDTHSDIDLEDTDDVQYLTDQYEDAYAIVFMDGRQQELLGLSDYLKSTLKNMPDAVKSLVEYEISKNNLEFFIDTEYNGVKMCLQYLFDENGYLIYRKESSGEGDNARVVEFTAKVYNKTKDLEVDAFLYKLHELENYSYDRYRFATVSATNIEREGTNPQTTKTGDFELVYYVDSQGQELARARITNEQGDVTTSVTVLGLSHMMSATVENAENGEYAVKRVGSNYDVTAEFDDAESHIHIIAHYVFDMNGYAVYMSYQGEGYATEFTATAYNKEEEGGDTITYTVTSEQWDKAVSLYWTNVTYEFTDGTHGNKVELLADGGLHQYEGAWGEFYVIYKNSKWQVYQGTDMDLQFEYSTPAEYIGGSYSDDFGFMGHMLPTIRGRMDEFTFDEANHQYVAENIGISMGPDDVYPMSVIAKFENQKLVYVKFEAVGGDEYMEATFTDYGTTTIEYPDYILNA